jgi:Uma2 family endonuclease
LAIVKRLDDFYGNGKPTGDDCLLLIEVSDSTLDYERNKKLPLYAEGNIPEFWLVNLQNNTIEVHTEPCESVYSLIRVLQRGETIKSESVPNLQIKADAILG